MSYYNPYQSTESYYDPYQNTQTDTPSASIGQAVKTLAIIGGLNIVGCAATKYLSSSIKSNLKSWSNSTNNSIKKAFATKVITTSNKISDRLAPLKESFHKTSIYQAAQARKATLAPLKGKTGYNLTRVSSAFKSPSAFIGTIAGVWKRNVLQGIGVAYGIDSMLGVTQDIGLQPKSWYDVPGQVSNFGKWLGMSSIFGLALGGGFAGIKATGAGALAGTRKVFGGEFGKKVLSNLAPVHPGVPNDLKYTTAYDGMPSMFNQEVIGALKSQQERKFAANSIKKGFTFASNVSSMFRNVNAAAHTLPDAFRDALKAPKGKRTETAFGTLKAAISNARAILNKPRDKLPSSITHPGIEALNFLQSMSKETSKIQTGSKELTDFFSLISKNSYKESAIDKTIPFLKPLINRDITSRNWQKEVLSGLSNRFVDQDSAKLLLDNVLNMRVGQNIYRDWRGGKQHGAGVNLNIFDPIYHMRRTASWIANQRFHLPLTKMNMSIGDLIGINEYLTEAPSLVFFNRRPNFQHRDGSIGDLGGDKAQFIYYNKQYLILDGSGAEVVNTNRKLRYSHKSGKNKSYELKTIGINRVKKAAIEAGVDFNEVVNRVDYFDAPTNPFLHFTDRLGIGWPGKIKDLAYQVRNKLEGKKKYQQYVNDFFTAPDIENSRALPIINDIYQTTSQVFSRVLQNKNALMHIASYTHDKTIGDNIVGMAFDDNKLVEIARNLDLKADKFRYRSDFVRAVENIKAFPEQARSHNVVQRLGPFSEMTSFDIMRKDLIEDIFNTDFRQAPAGHSHPLITASTELFEKHIITKKESDYLKLHAKLSVFRDEGLIRGVEHQQQYWPTILKNVKDRAKKHNWEYLDDITNFIANEDIKRPSISLSQQAILPKALREKFPHLNLYTSDVHPYTSVPDNAIGAIKELVERTVDSVTSQFPEWLPFKKRYISHHGFVGNLKYLGGIMGVTVGAFGAYRILDTVTATNPLFDNTMLDEGITGASADVLAKIRFGTSRVADVTGVTAAMKYMHGVAPTSESTIPGAVVGGIAGLVFRSGPMGVAKGILLGGVINRLASPFLPDMTKSHEELTEIYSGREQVPIKKAPLWLLGSTPIEGTKIIGYSPNWYVRAKSRWKESKNMYGSAYRRLIHEPLPLLGFNVGDIIEPYYMERCVTEDTDIISTNFITKMAKEIEINDSVITQDGSISEVIDKYTEFINESIIEIKSSLFNQYYKTTKEHRYLAIKSEFCSQKCKKDRICFNKTRNRCIVCKNKYFLNYKKEWIKAEDLKTGDFLVLPKIQIRSNGSIFNLNIQDAKLKRKLQNRKNIPNKIKKSNDLFRLIGYYLSEGSSNGGSIVFDFHTKEKEYHNDVINIIKNIFNINGKIYEDGNKTKIIFCNSILARLFKKIFGKNCYEKYIPEQILYSNKQLLENLIIGLFRGDGCGKYKTHLTFNTTSKKLATQTRYILFSLGYLSAFNINDRSKCNEHESYALLVHGEKSNKLKNIIGWNIIKEHICPKKTYYEDEKYFYIKIVDKKEINYSGNVVDLKIKNNFSFSSYTAVFHNTHYNTRPYLLTGGVFDEVPIIGRVLSSTVGRIIKPQKTMHQEYLQSDIQPDDNYPFAIRPPTVGEGLGMMKHRSNVRSMGGVTNNQGNIHIPNRHWGEGAAEDFLYDVQQFAGLKGFLAGSVTERIFGKDTVIPTYETAGRIASFSRSFHDLNMGGLYVACLPENEKVLTESGLISIQDINIGTKVYDQKFNLKKIIDKKDRICTENEKMYHITIGANKTIIKTTGNHPYAIYKRDICFDNYDRPCIPGYSKKCQTCSKKYNNIKWDWVRADEVKKGDFIVVPLPKEKKFNDIDLSEFGPSVSTDKYIYFRASKKYANAYEHIENNKNITRKELRKIGINDKIAKEALRAYRYHDVNKMRMSRYININEDFCYFLGWWLAEGSANKKTGAISFTLHSDEINVGQEIQKIFKKITNGTCRIYKKKNVNCISVQMCNLYLARYLSQFGKSHNKHLHEYIYLNDYLSSYLLKGLINGDGWLNYNKQKGGFTSVSSKLVRDIWLLLYRLGINSSISVDYIEKSKGRLLPQGKIRKNCKRSYLQFAKTAFNLLLKFFESKKSNGNISSGKTFTNDGYLYIQISDIYSELCAGTKVYDIEVDKSHCFIGNYALLHNSEQLRRLVDKPQYRQYGINPIQNMMPNFLPAEFLTGDPFSSIIRGELRIPGEAYMRTHPDVKRTMPMRASALGKTETEIVQYFTGLISPLAKQEFDILEKGTEFHESIQNTLAAEGLLIQAEALVQDVKNDITGHVDAIIRDGKGGAGRKALEIKTINNDAFQKMSGPKSEHMSQTNFYLRQLKLKNGTIMYVNRENPSEVKTYEVHYSQTMWERDLRKLKKSRAVAATMMEEGVGDTLGYSYSWVDRLRILSDVCILPDTPLFEGTKVINASDVKKETKLLTQSKIFNNVKEIHHNIYNNNIYSFKTLYNVNIGETFFTKDHPIFILDKQYIDLRVQGRKKGKIRYIDNALHRNVRCYNPNIGHFEKAENIKIGNIVILPIPRKNKFTPMLKSKYINHQNLIEKDQYIKIFNKGSRIYHKKTLEINKNSAYFMGLFLSEGSYSFNTYKKDNSLKGIELSFHKDEKKLHSFVIDFIKTQSNGFIKKNDKNNSTKITCGCSVLAHILYENVGHHCYEKRIPKSFFNAPSEIQLQLLKGIFDGDGHCDKNGRFELTSTSRNIIYGVYIILLQNGIISSIKCKKPSKIKFNDKNYNTRESFCLRIYGKHSRKFAKLIEYEEYPKTNIKYEKNNYIWIQNGYLCTIIKKIITKNYNGPIINFSVNKDNTFSSLSFLTHNCPNSQETKEAKHIVEQQIKFGVLTDEEVKKYKYALKMKRNRVRDYSLYPNRFKGKVFNPDTELNLQSENEDIKAASEYNLFSRMLGAGWENFTNTNNFLVNKLFAVKDPIEHYKMSRLYGKEYKPWNEPIRAWVEPTFRGLASKTNPIEGGIAFGVLGSVLGGGPIGATIGAAGGVAYGAANGLYRLLSNSTYIPSSVQEKRDIVSFFDAAKYERANMLAELSYGLTKNEYIQQRNNTLTAFNQSESSTVANLFRATPVFEKPYIAAFLNTKNQKERERILKYIPKELAFALKKQWNTDDNKEATSKYIDNVSQTAPKYKFDNSIMDPSVDLSDIQLKTIQEQGLDQFEFGLGWNEQMLRMQESNKKVSPIDIALKEAPTSTLNPGIIRATINDLFFKNNIKCSSQVYINNGDEVNRLNIIVRRDRSLTVINALDYRRKYFNNGY